MGERAIEADQSGKATRLQDPAVLVLVARPGGRVHQAHPDPRDREPILDVGSHSPREAAQTRVVEPLLRELTHGIEIERVVKLAK